MLKGIKAGPSYGIMVCGHGSRNQNAVGEFSKLAIRLRERFPQWPIDYGYLEFANPVLHKGLDALKEKGVDHILAVPGMLFAAGHAKNDLPSVLNSYPGEKSRCENRLRPRARHRPEDDPGRRSACSGSARRL